MPHEWLAAARSGGGPLFGYLLLGAEGDLEQHWAREGEIPYVVQRPDCSSDICRCSMPLAFHGDDAGVFKNCLLYTSDAADDTPC
eukprot:7806940-Pyramimonas_sp.AAC.1